MQKPRTQKGLQVVLEFMVKEITHNGITLKTKFYRELSDEEYNEIVE